jgi:hypothetical protein
MSDAIIQSLTSLVDRFKAVPNAELEGSLGTIAPTGFISGVSSKHFHRSYGVLDNTQSIWDRVLVSQHLATYSFPDDVRGRYTEDAGLNYVRKRRLESVDINVKNRLLDLRVTLSFEDPLSSSGGTQWKYVRLQERWSLVYKNTWQFDFTKVASGKTKELACATPPVFEIEIELLRTTDTLRTASQHLAESLLLKLLDLLGRFGILGDPVSFDCVIAKTWSQLDHGAR